MHPKFDVVTGLFLHQDSLLDIVTSLGADEGKIILTATAFGNRFTLLDSERNVPGAASIGRPETITYQQVEQSNIFDNCKLQKYLSSQIKWFLKSWQTLIIKENFRL